MQYTFSPRRMIYANVQQGFKSGGFAVGANAPAFEPETIWSYDAPRAAVYFHIDIAEVRTEEGKLHLFVAVDRTSKYTLVKFAGPRTPSSMILR